jgi:hypothetical protein
METHLNLKRLKMILMSSLLVGSFSSMAIDCTDPFADGCGLNADAKALFVSMVCSSGHVISADGSVVDKDGVVGTSYTDPLVKNTDFMKACKAASGNNAQLAVISGNGVDINSFIDANAINQNLVSQSLDAASLEAFDEANREVASVDNAVENADAIAAPATPAAPLTPENNPLTCDGATCNISNDGDSPGGSGYTRNELLNMDAEALVSLAITRNMGDCAISDATTCSTCACDYYMRRMVSDETVFWEGAPQSASSPNYNTGTTGCTSATYMDVFSYPPAPDPDAVSCDSSNDRLNGACILKWGLATGYCSP